MNMWALLAALGGMGVPAPALLQAEEMVPSTAPAAVVPPGDSAPESAGPVVPADSRLQAAEAELYGGHPRSARKKTLDVLHQKPSTEGWVLLGRTYLAEERPKKAVKFFNRALRLDPHCAPAYFGRGEAFEKRGRLDEAANEYRAAALADPVHSGAQSALGRLKDESSLPE